MKNTGLTRRELLRKGVAISAGLAGIRLFSQTGSARRDFDVLDYGAAADGKTPDTAAIQRAIDEASAVGGRVLFRGGRRFLAAGLLLRGGIEFHLADDAELMVSTERTDYTQRAVLTANDAYGLRITGTGRINGRSPEFMDHYDEKEEWWRPKGFRPQLVVLSGCHDLEIRDVTLHDAPSWTVHLAGCRGVLVDHVKIRNQLDVPNCDGIDPDHCRDVEIRNCDIACGDDAIVIKTTRGGRAYGGSGNIVVKDCVLETQDSGLKIGTETVADIRGVRFENCRIKSGCRGCTIQLRDEGNVSDVEFRNIRFTTRYFSAPWWGRGEAISFTAVPRTPDTKVGTISNVRVTDTTGRAENSVRVSGSPESRIRDVRFERLDVTLDRWTRYPGAVWDNRPTTAMPALEEHATPAIHVRHADNIAFQDCRVDWGEHCPDTFTYALEAEDVSGLTTPGFRGEAAHPERDPAIRIHQSNVS